MIQFTVQNSGRKNVIVYFACLKRHQFQLSEQIKIINDGMTLALKSIGALETTVTCYTYHNDMIIMERSFCVDGM